MRDGTTEPAAVRQYRKRKRAEQEQATRDRIAAAAATLHETVGPARTTVKAIAERAGVQRATVYRHFPDDHALFDACTAHYYGRHPRPDTQPWAAIDRPDERLHQALTDLYAWYRDTEAMLANVTRDAAHVPAGTRRTFLGYIDSMRGVLMAGRPDRGRMRTRRSAAIGHAIAFSTWRSLTREQGLEDRDAVALMVAMVEAAADDLPRRRRA